jgi:hypothetical protein
MKKKREVRKQKMSVKDAMDLIDDDLPDGAYWAMVAEMADCEIDDVAAELASEDE